MTLRPEPLIHDDMARVSIYSSAQAALHFFVEASTAKVQFVALFFEFGDDFETFLPSGFSKAGPYSLQYTHQSGP